MLMEIINNNTVVVFTSEELKSVLESDNTYTYIYIGNNITLTLEEHSTFNITTYNGLSYGTFGTSNTTLNEGSSLKLKKLTTVVVMLHGIVMVK